MTGAGKHPPPKRKAPGGKPGAEAGNNSSREALHTDYHIGPRFAMRWQVSPDLLVTAFALDDRVTP